MINVNELCFSCMRVKGNETFCPHCGFNNSIYKAPPHHLAPGTYLNRKYVVGKALGEGGFGITYIGYDINLDMRLAIKEYFPNGFVSRDVANSNSLTIFTGTDADFFAKGRQKFINEAKVLARFDNTPGIVSVKDFFTENDTAYIAMEYIEGMTLKDYLAVNGGKLAPETVFEMMKPLMRSLSQVHRKGLIHRDISPDNIMLTQDSQVKLLDFGAARDMSADGMKSLSIVLKPGYAPEEQYRTHGKQGPWTDVYALCATMYTAITGTRPQEALERLRGDTLAAPSQLGVRLDPYKEAALMHGMAVTADRRTPNMDALYAEMYNAAAGSGTFTASPTVAAPAAAYAPQKDAGRASGRRLSTPIIIVAAAIGVVLIVVAVILVMMLSEGRDSGRTTHSNATLGDTVTDTTPIPTPTPTPIVYPDPQMTEVTVSSIRGTDSEGGQYSKEAVLYDDPTTKWVPRKSSGSGEGEWVQISAPQTQYVHGVTILNGYHKDAETWRNNNRVKLCTLTFSTGESRQFVLDDTMETITIDFGGVVETTSVRLTIDSVYSGTKWDDTAITYFNVY